MASGKSGGGKKYHRGSRSYEREQTRKRKAAIAETKKQRSTKEKREYAKRAKALAKFVPSLKKYTSAASIDKKAERAIRFRERQLKHIYNLRPVSKAVAKRNKTRLFAPGVQAIQLSEFSSDAKIKSAGKGTTIISNGRTWLLIPMPTVNWRSKKSVAKAGRDAFSFPIEAVISMAEIAFKKYKPLGISLWAKQGRAARIHGDIEDFMRFVNQHWQAGKYISSPNPETGRSYASDPDKWINGIAVLLKEGH